MEREVTARSDMLASALLTIASWRCLPDRVREDAALAAAFLILHCGARRNRAAEWHP